MKLTPLDIRQKKFEKSFRGLDIEEVKAFLKIVSKEWEDINEEKRILEIKLQTKERELNRLVKVEDTLFKTLSTAEETGKTIINQANKEVEILIKQKKLEANNIIDTAKKKADSMIKQAKQLANNHLEQTINKLNTLQNQLINLSDSYENIISQINSLTETIRDNTDRKKENFDFNVFKSQILESQSQLSKLLIENTKEGSDSYDFPEEIDKVENNIDINNEESKPEEKIIEASEMSKDIDLNVDTVNAKISPIETTHKTKNEVIVNQNTNNSLNNTEFDDNLFADGTFENKKMDNNGKNESQTLSFFDEI